MATREKAVKRYIVRLSSVVVGGGVETDRVSIVVDAGDLGLYRPWKILRGEWSTGGGSRIALVGMAGDAAAVVSCNHVRVVDAQKLIEGRVSGVVDSRSR